MENLLFIQRPRRAGREETQDAQLAVGAWAAVGGGCGARGGKGVGSGPWAPCEL